VQELLLAKQRVVCVGKTQIPWEDFYHLIDFCEDHRGSFLQPEDHSHYSIKLVEGFVSTARILPIQKSERLALEIIIAQYHNQPCLGKRDNIYAFLSLAGDCVEIIPNYERSSLDLFFLLKEKVANHGILQNSLMLPVDEIRCRAEMLGLNFHEFGESIYIRCSDEDDEAWNEKRERFPFCSIAVLIR